MEASLLHNIGMNPKEARAYLTLLQLGGCRASLLSQRLALNRTSAYSLLHGMIAKGFAGYYEKRGVKIFTAGDPRALIDRQVSAAKQLFDHLPELLAIHNRYGQKPKITFYEGVEGIKQICETLLLVPGSQRDSFMGVDEATVHPEIKRYFEEDFIARRIDKGITYRGIVTGYIPWATAYSREEETQKRELKYVDPARFPIQIQIDIYPENKVALYSYRQNEMMGVIIEHEAFYITMKTAFALAWAGVPC